MLNVAFGTTRSSGGKKANRSVKSPTKHMENILYYINGLSACASSAASRSCKFLPPRREKNQELRGRRGGKGEQLRVLEVFHPQWIFGVVGRRVKEGDAMV